MITATGNSSIKTHSYEYVQVKSTFVTKGFECTKNIDSCVKNTHIDTVYVSCSAIFKLCFSSQSFKIILRNFKRILRIKTNKK